MTRVSDLTTQVSTRRVDVHPLPLDRTREQPTHSPPPSSSFREGVASTQRRAISLPPAVADVRDVARRVLGELPPEADVVLAKADAKSLDRVKVALERLEARPADERSTAVRQALRNEWLINGRSLENVAMRLETALDTGYVLVDRGPLASNARDTLGFSDDDLRRLQPLLTGLPPKLENRGGLTYITRDARSEGDEQVFAQLREAIDSSTRPVMKAVAKLLFGVVDRANLGFAFGTAYYGSREVRLYSELFAGSKLPGFDKMLAYTTIHEIGHHALRGDADLFARWSTFYEQTGKAEAPNGYAGGSVDEGFGVALGMFAVAPDTLKAKSPHTYEFLHAEYGDSLAAYRGRGLEPKVIELVYGVQDKLMEKQQGHAH